ncbi:MAG: hypothetical protein HZB99_00675 [Candidatus Harrisonbacteria bacterium]|nr:hypothetical protein [Candidatus Harrisonbacteria bacterium]
MGKTTDTLLDGLKERRGQLGKLQTGVTTITGLDELDVTKEGGAKTTAQVLKGASSKLAEAKVFGDRMEQELRDLCMGLETKLEEIGYSVSDSYRFRGTEKVWAFFGGLGLKSCTDRAQRLRLHRLQTQDVQESVKEVNDLVEKTIRELGEIEKQYLADIGDVKAGTGYNATLRLVIEKLKEAQPKFREVKERREKFETELKTLQMELESGTVSESERPAKEDELEELRKNHQKAYLLETELHEVIQNAQRAIPEIQKNRDAAQQAVQSLRQMRRGLLEKMENFRIVLETAMTAVRARAKLERYENVDPALNKTITLLSEHNVKVAAAAMEIAIERAKHAAINPEDSARLLNELTESINTYATELAALEEDAKQGARKKRGTSQANGDGN